MPVGVMVAPIIPGLNDHEMPAILEAAAEAGAMRELCAAAITAGGRTGLHGLVANKSA